MPEPTDGWSRIDDRIASGMAAAPLEARGISMGHGSRAFAGRGRELAELVDQVVRRLGEGADDDLVREAVEDAMEGRRPRW